MNIEGLCDGASSFIANPTSLESLTISRNHYKGSTFY